MIPSRTCPANVTSAARLARTRWARAVPILLTVGGLAACGGTTDASNATSDVAAANEVASLETTGAAGTVAAETATDPGEAALAFSQCLRDEGLDVADIGVDADGNIDLRDALEGVDREDDSVREAMDACRDLLGDTAFGGGGRGGGLADNTVVQDALIEVTDCVREQGYPDATELTLGPPQGGGAPPEGERPEQGGQGAGQGPGQGDIGPRLAEQMGLDPEDPDVVAALDVCTPILEAAFTDAGIGQPGQPPQGG